VLAKVEVGFDGRGSPNALVKAGVDEWGRHGFLLLTQRMSYEREGVEHFSTRTADCLKLGSREMGSNALCVS
jgi:hypothetical protein